MNIFAVIYFCKLQYSGLCKKNVRFVYIDVFAAIYCSRISLSGENRENKLLAKINWFTVLREADLCLCFRIFKKQVFHDRLNSFSLPLFLQPIVP